MNRAILRVLNWFSGALLLATVGGAIVHVVMARFDPAAVNRAIFLLLTAFIPFALGIGKSILEQLRHLSEGMQRPTATALRSPEALYGSICSALDAANKRSGPKILRHGILHGHVGEQRVIPAKRARYYSRFDDELTRCVKSSGPNSWQVRQIYLIASEDRLNMVLQWLNEVSNAQHFSVRVFVPPFALPCLSPIIVDETLASLAVDDPGIYRVKSGVELTGREVVAVLSDYFDAIWNDSRAHEIRSVNRMIEPAVASLRQELDGLEAVKHRARPARPHPSDTG
jgi:hypothetical protein